MNKIRYGLKNVHYAPLTFPSGVSTFGTPVKIPGSVSLSMSKNSEDINFYADDGVYFALGDNSSFDGELELALIPDGFHTSMLGDTLDDNNVLATKGDQERGHFALLFEFAGDQKGIRHVIYNCTASPDGDTSGETKKQGIEVKTEKLKLSAMPLPDTNYVKAKTGDTTDSTVYDDWYDSVYTPTVTTTGNG